MKVGVGTIFARCLARVNIKYESGNKCNCYPLMKEMDRKSPQDIESKFDDWVGRIDESANQWFKAAEEDGKYVQRALKPAQRLGIPMLLRYSIRKAKQHGD